MFAIWQRMMSSLNALAVLVEKASFNNTSGSATLNLLQSQVLFQMEFMSLRYTLFLSSLLPFLSA